MGGITRLLLLLLAGVTVSTAVDLHKRIMRGQDCDNNERHHHVKLTFPKGDICGGTLISKSWILTAEHCKDKTITAYLGLHPHPGQNIQPMQITDPPVTFGAGHDIMLLKLPKATTAIQPAPLPECKNRPKKGKKVQIAGYGPTGDNQPQAAVLQCGISTVIADCPPLTDTGHVFCGDPQTAIPMGGDSGGGVLYNKKIYGVISSGTPEGSIFMDVCEYMDWIQRTIG